MITRRHARTDLPGCVIVLRQSPDWRRLTYSDLDVTERLDRALRRPPGFLRQAIELWDSTFTSTFFEVRQALKDIAMRSFAAVRGATVIPASEVDPWPPADVTLFSDDDDWYAPHVVEHLGGVPRRTHGATWTSIYFTGEFTLRKPGFCYTNNYVVMAGAPLGGPWTERVLQHGRADVTFRDPGFRTAELAQPLSASNKHPASAQMIRDALAERPGRDGLVAAVEGFNRRVAQAEPPTGDLAWASEPAAAVAEIFAGLRVR